MKTFPVGSIPCSRLITLALVLAGLIQTPAIAASGGEVDLTFDPLPDEIPPRINVLSADPDVFVGLRSTNTLLRLKDDGRVDTDSGIASPSSVVSRK